MVPTANLIGFAGQELARKLPKVFGMFNITYPIISGHDLYGGNRSMVGGEDMR